MSAPREDPAIRVIAEEVLSAARWWGRPVPDDLRASALAEPVRTARGADLAAAIAVGRLWQSGWLPLDAHEVGRKKLRPATAALALDVVAADLARYGHTLPRRWQEQFGRLGAPVWWDPERPHLSQWAARSGKPFPEALATLLTVLRVWARLPKLPRIAPLPGAGDAGAATGTSRVDPKVLARVRGLLAKAESTSFPEEAEALSAKAQELMQRHAFARALVDADPLEATATSSRLWLDAPYVEAKSHLVAAIARANRCRSVCYAGIELVCLVGEELDLDITELLTTSLLVQATKAMVAEGTTRRAFRRAFLLAFAVRIGQRLTDAANHARDTVTDERLLPVLAARSRAVDMKFDELFSDTVRKRVSFSDGAGWRAGYAAADRADLTLDRGELSA